MSKSYKKAITVGVAAFSAVALLTTGTAAFILATEQTKTTTGNVTVGQVVDNNIVLKVNAPTNEIVFDASSGDTTGKVQWDGTNSEKLTTEVTGYVLPEEFATAYDGGTTSFDSDSQSALAATLANYDLYWTLTISTDGAEETGDDVAFEGLVSYYTGNASSSEKHTASSEVAVLDSGIYYGASSKNVLTPDANGVFKITLSFTWGSLYGNKNPSVYFDEDSQADIDHASLVSSLEAMNTLDGINFDITVYAKYKAAGN